MNPILAGVDLARGRDQSAIALVECIGDGNRIVRSVSFGPWDTRDIERAFANVYRDRFRPRGYSRSHWRKLWRQNVHG